MVRLETAKFRKSTNCPASQDLLAYQNGDIAVRERERIMIHLRFCEFCTSEVEFYDHYPQAEETVEKAEIPQPLYELAEALLSNKYQDNRLFRRLFGEQDDADFTDL